MARVATLCGVTRQLRDRFGTTNAVVGGLGAMLGAGVLVGLAPAAGLAGRWMLVGLAIAALAAVCTACSTTDLARAYPGAGGGYRYARELLGRWPGRLAGGVGLLGRVAAMAAVAGCFGAYVTPQRPVLGAVAALVLAIAAEIAAVRMPVLLGRVLIAVVLVTLAVVVAACFAVPAPVQVSGPLPAGLPGADNPVELLPAAGLLFFGFLGDARAETGSRPRTKLVVPVLILIALGTCLAVGTALLRELGPTRMALSPDPLRDALAAANASALDPILTAGVAAATIGVLFALVGGTRQTAKAMAEAGDLPIGLDKTVLGAVVVGVAGILAVLLLTPVAAIELAATCGLFAAAFTNAAGRMLERHERVWPARTACLGLGLCVLLVVAMPPTALALSVLAMAVGAGIGPLVSLTRRKPVPERTEHERALKI
ncbi:MAG TPA: amino acid permease [Pseudonocardiaceae bacterium]|jgi:APA family basic amino acid/polyamine antiporter|nr:amino acid permease [Pseudonocardiaceae bacterium]